MDARKFSDPEADRILQDIHVQEIKCYNRSGSLPKLDVHKLDKLFGVEISDFDSRTFNGQLHPEVEGYEWYRGIAVEVLGIIPSLVGKNQVFIFTGWMQPWREGGAPDPVVYTHGNVGRADVLDVVRIYTAGRRSSMELIQPRS